MASTDLCSSRKTHVHNRMSLRQPLRCGLSILICSCLFAGAAQCRARVPQDVAEAARQERARKGQQKKSKHVYTDEDLRRAKILTPEDEARVEARRELQPPSHEEQAQAPANGDEIAQLPLGDIARRYRNAKLAAQAPDPFHLPFDEPVFAEPVVELPTVAPPRPSFYPTHPNPVAARTDVVAAPAVSSAAPSQPVDPPIALPQPARPAISFVPAHPKALPVTPDVAVAPAIRGAAPAGGIGPAISAAKPGRPEASFAAARPNLLAATPHEAVAPAIANAVPPGSNGLAISAPKPGRPATGFAPTHPNLTPAKPGAVVAPAMPSAPLRRVDPFTRRFAPAAPAPAARIAAPAVQPKAAPAIAPAAPKSNVSKTGVPAVSQPSVAPGVAPAGTIEKLSVATHMVTVQPGDSLWKLAQQKLGRGSRWQELLAANPSIVDPTRIAAGTEIVIPAKATGLKADLKVTVKQGDTLSEIARLTYGRAAAWRCIAQANPEIADANRIYKGQQLMLPFSCNR